MSGAILNQPAEKAAFEIINSINIVFIIKAQCVTHQNQMHFLVVLHLNGVNAVDARDERVFILLQMCVKLRQDLLKQNELLF